MKSVSRVQSAEFSEKIDSYKDLLVWKKALSLVKTVYKVTQEFPKDEMWSLTSQVKRAAVSIASNIAEGSSKRSTREFIRFLNMSYGSLSELEAQLIIAHELEFINKGDLDAVLIPANEIGKMLNGLIRSLNNKLNSEL